MARVRKPITRTVEGKKNVARFCHPMRHGKTVRFFLGEDVEARRNLEALNRIFLVESNWVNPPTDTPDLIKTQWLGSDGFVKIKARAENAGRDIAVLQAEVTSLLAIIETRDKTIRDQNNELKALRGKKYCKEMLLDTLECAFGKWLADYSTPTADVDHKRTVKGDVARFVKHFGPKSKLFEMEGNEGKIRAWIHGLTRTIGKGENAIVKPLSPGRKHHVRVYCIKFLADCGVELDRKAITPVKQEDIDKARGGIKALDKRSAEAMVKALPTPWNDVFRIQTTIGLRPDECITLHRNNFADDFSRLTLSPLGALTLKTGGRTIPIPGEIRDMIMARVALNPIVFPHPKTGKAWGNPKNFDKRYAAALKKTAKALSIDTTMDARTARRTCASLLLQAGESPARIASLLGNTIEMILSHYGDPDTLNMDLSASTLCK